ncbi:hypothetical protein EHS13_17740 [Paenibacillus psychroresistens]|uniref:Uncharacterized protein n=1 Tax=Paenibacillus psychroresistens TaxID=1778678 RepID=A0A6B8RLF0_9BACL|nr:hypothetical protein [Paenibacillus psychroresistens]QGQ96584.1 hypothetical protein EHS13_17740 [Paenibacillus psychroresistens]
MVKSDFRARHPSRYKCIQFHLIGINAFNFTLYEGSDDTYDIQLIGSDEFDENDSDWACTDYLNLEENICSIKRTEDIQEWEQGLKYITMLVERYLKEGEYVNVLKSASAIGIGFVDGDIDILFCA